LRVNFKKLSEKAVVPKYQTSGSAGFDLHSTETATIEPNSTALIGSGLAFELPEGYEMQIRPRSGLALKHSITVLNSPGTIDSDYRGEIKVILINHRTAPFKIEIGERIAQAVITKYETVSDFSEVDELSDTERASKGFGSTGK
jgi:dUTP pyrophosphatase